MSNHNSSILNTTVKISRNLAKNTCNYFFVSNSQKGIAQLALVILLLVGVVVGTYVVQNRTNIFPKAAEPVVNNENCTKVSQTGRTEKELSDGSLEITFTWGDGRKTYDYKSAKQADGDRILIGSRSKGVLKDGTTIFKSGTSKTVGSTITQGWSDGSVEYSTIGTGTNHQGIDGTRIDVNYIMVPKPNVASCDPGSTTPPKTGTTTPKTPTTPTKTGTTTPKTPTTPTITNTTKTPTLGTAPKINTSTTPANMIYDRLVALQKDFDSKVVSKIQTYIANNPGLDPKIKSDLTISHTNATKILRSGVRSIALCIETPTPQCNATLQPYLDYSLVSTMFVTFKGIYYGIPDLCTRADFNITPAIIAKVGEVEGPIHVCNGFDGKEKKWRIFDTKNNPYQLTPNDAAIWKTLSGLKKITEYPVPFQAKYRQAEELVGKALIAGTSN